MEDNVVIVLVYLYMYCNMVLAKERTALETDIE